MSKKIFLDTNILLDAAMKERPGWEAAQILIDECAYKEAVGYISALSLKDVYYILTKYANEASAREFILAAMDLFTVVGIDAALCRVAALSDEPDFEDGIIRFCAESVPVDFIISRDEKAFAHSSLKRLSAQEYIDLFCNGEYVSLSKNHSKD